MKIFGIACGNFKVDGGAMFGVVPKAIWSKRYPCDENNLCNITTRNLLIDTGDRRILFDTGIGTRVSKDFLKYQYLNGDDTLLGSLQKYGYSPDDITDVVFTHLHWDHCGGALMNDAKGNPALQFPKAQMWVSRQQWEWAINPNIREDAAYPENLIRPLNSFGNLRFIEKNEKITPDIELRLHNGHTKGLLIPVINFNGRMVVFAGDLIPVAANIPPIYLSAYDIFPLDAIHEKEQILKELVNKNGILIFQHDIRIEAATVIHNEKGYQIGETFTIDSLN
ncbi:MAG TPA: MBL fold metallo-hydrolase [Salinivirgaceae bacterium]|nr:MBL fold metallo-hydrolase [Salinivirgaceae bacterium]